MKVPDSLFLITLKKLVSMHLFTSSGFGKKLQEIEFWEGGHISFDDKEIWFSGDNGIFVTTAVELKSLLK